MFRSNKNPDKKPLLQDKKEADEAEAKRLKAIEEANAKRLKAIDEKLNTYSERKKHEESLLGLFEMLHTLHLNHEGKTLIAALEACYTALITHARYQELRKIAPAEGINHYARLVSLHLELMSQQLSHEIYLMPASGDKNRVITGRERTLAMFEESYNIVKQSLKSSIRKLSDSCDFWQAQAGQTDPVVISTPRRGLGSSRD